MLLLDEDKIMDVLKSNIIDNQLKIGNGVLNFGVKASRATPAMPYCPAIL